MKLHRGPFFFYFYIGEMLMMCRLFGEDGGSRALVPSDIARGPCGGLWSPDQGQPREGMDVPSHLASGGRPLGVSN